MRRYNPVIMSTIFKNIRVVIVTMLMLTLPEIGIEAQPVDAAKAEKSKLTIKPNSRDMNVVLRDNSMQRIGRERQKQAVQKKMQQMRQQKVGSRKLNQAKRQEMIQRRNQMIQQRNSKRR